MAELILNSRFGRAIFRTIRVCQLRRVLEIGSRDGDGSTQVLIAAMQPLPDKRLVCLEIEKPHEIKLRANTAAYNWVETRCESSISWSSFTLRDFDRDVWRHYSSTDEEKQRRIRGHWTRDIQYLQSIESGFLERSREFFDAALLDGGVFTGDDEFRLLRDRVDCFMLDDVFHGFKNRRVHESLLTDPAWTCVFEDRSERLGTSIFVRRHRLPRLARRWFRGLVAEAALRCGSFRPA